MGDEIKNVKDGMDIVCPIHFNGEKDKDGMYAAGAAPGQLLYTVPLNLHQHEMIDFMNADEDLIVEYMSLPTMMKGNIASTDIAIQKAQIIEYIKRNTFDNFSTMIDKLDPVLIDVLKLTRIKEIAFNNLGLNPDDYVTRKTTTDEYDNHSSGVVQLQNELLYCISRFFQGINKYPLEDVEEYKLAFNNEAVRYTTECQITTMIYSILAYSIDSALTESFNNVYNIPNFKEAIEMAMAKLAKGKLIEETTARKFKNNNTGYEYAAFANSLKEFMISELTSIMPAVQFGIDHIIYHSCNVYSAFKDKVAASARIQERLKRKAELEQNKHKFPHVDDEED